MKCLYCEEEVNRDRLNAGKKTCSAECYEREVERLREEKGRKSEEEVKARKEAKCLGCGKEVGWSGTGRPREYCSAMCRKGGPKRSVKSADGGPPCIECGGPCDNGGRVRWGGMCTKCHYGITDGSMIEKPAHGEVDVYVEYTEERGWGWKDDEWIGPLCPDGRSPKCEKRMRKESVQHRHEKCIRCRLGIGVIEEAVKE